MSAEQPLDCRSEEGVTVGLIDGIIATFRVLRLRLQEGGAQSEVIEALKDLAQDEDLALVLAFGNEVKASTTLERAE